MVDRSNTDVYVYFNFNVAAHNDDDERRRQMSVTLRSYIAKNVRQAYFN